MADEFIKGLGALTVGGLGWMVLSGWYNTPTFEAQDEPQLIAPDPTNLGRYGEGALVLRDMLFWFALLGALSFWVIIPAVEKLRNF